MCKIPLFPRGHRPAATLLAMLVTGAVLAAPTPVEKQAWYYGIGGADPVSVPMNPGVSPMTLGFSGTLGLGYSCGNFDPTASVSNMFNDVGNSLQNRLMGAAQGAIAALPLYIIQRARPGLYELFQSYVVDFTKQFNLALGSCEQYEQQILAGNDPYAGWVQMAKGESWRTEMAGGNDAVEAKANVESSGGDNGFTWIGGNKVAGAGMPPARVIEDTTEAGWNMELNRPPTSAAPFVPGPNPPRLAELFPTPGDASTYAVGVLGDQIVRTCDSCTGESVPGHGLLPRYDRERTAVANDLGALIAGGATPAFADLEKVTAPGVGISARVIETLREIPPDEAQIMAGRLAAEVAVARTAEKALAIRRLLLSARRIPEVQASKEAREVLDTAVAELEREVDNLLYEVRVRREIASSTAGALVARDNELRGEGSRTPTQPAPPPSRFKEGGGFE